jgi:hypothetical protein
MPKVMIRYKVKRDQVERNLELLRAFFDELESIQPDGLRYAVFQLADEVSFMHLVETEQGPGPLPTLAAFQRYRTTIDERCDEPPIMTHLNEVGSFRFR